MKDFFKKKQPFAVMQYNCNLIHNEDNYKKYEMIYLENEKKVRFKVLDNKLLLCFKENIDKFNLVLNNTDGKVYEFMEFKKYKDSIL
jgi:hypothetical protein